MNDLPAITASCCSAPRASFSELRVLLDEPGPAVRPRAAPRRDAGEGSAQPGGGVPGWQLPFELMQDSWRCVSYDHRGSGASTAPPADIHPQGTRRRPVCPVLDHYGIDGCVVAGESMGALTVISAALQQPERFAGWSSSTASPRRAAKWLITPRCATPMRTTSRRSSMPACPSQAASTCAAGAVRSSCARIPMLPGADVRDPRCAPDCT